MCSCLNIKHGGNRLQSCARSSFSPPRALAAARFAARPGAAAAVEHVRLLLLLLRCLPPWLCLLQLLVVCVKDWGSAATGGGMQANEPVCARLLVAMQGERAGRSGASR